MLVVSQLLRGTCDVFNICFSFFHQLYSLNDYKPPISKAKMTQITKAAIKAIKVRNKLVS